MSQLGTGTQHTYQPLVALALQAEDLGKLFRTVMYPRYGPAGNGFLRLHSTYRHDLKIYTSDEGRVQTSAAAFTQGLLDLEGTSLTPILVRYGPCHNPFCNISILFIFCIDVRKGCLTKAGHQIS